MSLSLRMGLLAGGVALLFGAAAQASPIEYIFSGTGSGSANGTAFSGDFTVTLDGDTSQVNVGVESAIDAISATFVANSGTLTATLAGISNEVLDNTVAPGLIGFGQAQVTTPFFVADALANSAFETYDLTTAFPLTADASLSLEPNSASNPFFTTTGDLEFDSITSLSFQAVTPSAVPEPASGTLMLVGMGILAYRRRRRAAIG